MPKNAIEVKSKVTTAPVELNLAETNKSKEALKKVFNLFMKISTTQVLVTLLLVASFLIGVLVTKVQYLEKNQLAGQAVPSNTDSAKQPSQGLTDGQKVNVANGNYPVLGKEDAKVTLVEFADFRCPFCEKFYTDTLSQIKKDYIDTGKVKLYFRNFAFLGEASTFAANAAECANDQGKFWDMHDYLFKNQPDESDTSMYNVDTLTEAAGTLGLDTSTFKSCLSDTKDKEKVAKDISEAQTAGVSGTPTLFINGIAVIGAQPYSAFKTIIDQEIEKAK